MPDGVTRTSPSPQPPALEPLPENALPVQARPKSPAPDGSLSLAAQQLVEGHTAGMPSLATLREDPRARAWSRDKAAAETACLLPCPAALRTAELGMPDDGLAESMMNHFLSGSSAPVRVDLNVELQRNPEFREYLAGKIESEIAQAWQRGTPLAEMSGAIWVSQAAYGSSDAGKDQRLALGGSYFEYQVAGTAGAGGLEVRVNVSDHYFWSPSEKARATQCLHACGASLVASGRATEFYQVGEGTLVVADPSRHPPMTQLEVEVQDDA